jgi:hypothetical protein
MEHKMNKPLALALSACFVHAAVAQSKDGNDEPSVVVYKIKAGDTFSKVANKYLQQPLDMAAIQKANQLKNIDLLPVGAELMLPRHLIKQSPSKASIMSLSCATPIRLASSPKPLSVGAVVTEGAIIEVPPECHVSLLLEDGSIIRLPSSAALQITTLRKNALEAAPEVRLDLTRGRVELDVHKGRAKTTPFEIRTPLSIMGVRGTEFRVGYSPEDHAGQVEVLGGIVQTRGSTDTQARAITKGLGVPIDGAGKALGIEKLLAPPSFESAVATAGAQPSFVAKLSPVPLANYYVADNSNTANLTGNRSSQNLLAPELFIPRVTKQASFYQLTSVSASGLVGIERHYAFCAAPNDGKQARCSAMFDAPLADGTPINFQLSRSVDGELQQLVNTQSLQARNGRFAIQGLPAGHYSWTLSYAMVQSPNASGTDTVIRQAGSFELIPLLAPHKP